MGGRLPVDGKKVSELRLTLGTFERNQLDTLVTGLTVKNVANPFVNLISDISALSFLFSAYMTYVYGDDVLQFISKEYTDVTQIIRDYQFVKGEANIIIKNAIPFGLGFLPSIINDAINIIQGEG